jgi:NADH-ubiquinone oxidoreductase chain 4L
VASTSATCSERSDPQTAPSVKQWVPSQIGVQCGQTLWNAEQSVGSSESQVSSAEQSAIGANAKCRGLFLSGLFVFVFNCKHLLDILLSLEFIVLRLFIFIFIYLNLYNYECFFRILFLTFSVCEGALGLSILVSIIRTHGNDYFNSFNILQC